MRKVKALLAVCVEIFLLTCQSLSYIKLQPVYNKIMLASIADRQDTAWEGMGMLLVLQSYKRDLSMA